MSQPNPDPRSNRRSAWSLVAGALVVLSVMALASCGDKADDTSGEDPTTTTATTTTAAGSPAGGEGPKAEDLEGRTFLSTAVEGHEMAADSVLRLSFEGELMAANSGCNTITGGFEVEAGKLAWTDTPAATMMACEDDLMAQDTWVTEILTAGMAAELEDTKLTLTGDGVTVVLEEESDVSLTGTAWTLDTLISQEAASSLPAGVEAPTLEIAEDGTVTLFAGCNRGTGTAVVGDGTLELGPIGLTMMACEGDAAQVEAAVVAVLDGTVQVAVDGKVLTITKGDNALGFRAL